MRTIFALASGRSGTRFLYEIFHRNAAHCVAKHETYFFNPSMFGRPIYDHAQGNSAAVRPLVAKKHRVITRYAPATYVETSHAFLKSYYDVAPEFFSELQVVHLIRHPLKTAKSMENREKIGLRIPFGHYRGGDGRKYFRWSLTGLEPIYQNFDLAGLTRFQWYVLEWIEVENRAMQFLNRFAAHAPCETLRVPQDFQDAIRIRGMFERFSLATKNTELDLTGWENRTPGLPTVLTDDDERQFREVLQHLPPQYLAIFQAEPYTTCSWNQLLTK